MSTPFNDLRTIAERYGSYGSDSSDAWILTDCPNCTGSQMAVIAVTRSGDQQWLRCVNCRTAVVNNGGTTSPGAAPLRNPAGVSGAELAAWKEVRQCLSVGASTAAVMICRKILLHVAVANGLPAEDDRGRAPTYAAAAQHLEDEGIVTSRMRPWIDRVKDVGNEANHEISPINADVALDVATFTEQLLRLAYEMDALMAAEPTADE